MKRYFTLIMMFLFLLNGILTQHVFAQNDIKVKFNDKQLAFDAKPFVKDGRTFVPFRKILEAFGAEVSWDKDNQMVIAKRKSTEIYLKIGVNYAYVNSAKVDLDVSPEVTGGRTFVPLRFISENLGAEVNWDKSTGTVAITYESNTFKVGQEGTYKDMKFSINKIETSPQTGVLKVIGKLNFDAKDVVVEVADNTGYVLSAEIVTTGISGDMNNIEAKVWLPGCHNFVGKYVIIKKPNAEQKLERIAEYEI